MSLPRPLPLGNSSFSRIKVAGQIYVDKTRLIFDLSSKKEKFLLTRPRRFGKSLLISTFESLFKFGLRFSRFRSRYWVMEFKCAERAENASKKLEEAVSQLNEENYRLQRRDAEIIRFVLVFSLEKREYVEWKSL